MLRSMDVLDPVAECRYVGVLLFSIHRLCLLIKSSQILPLLSSALSSGHAVKVKVYLANEARATMEKEVTLLPLLYISKTKYLPMLQSLPAPFIVIPMKWFF